MPKPKYPFQTEVVKILEDTGAFLQGHFVYTSGRHGSEYIDKDLLLAHPSETYKICRYMAEQFAKDKIEVVIGPAMGGVNLAFATALNLIDITKQEVLSVFTERETKLSPHELRPSYLKYLKGKKILAIEDNTTTGGSIAKIGELVRIAGGYLSGVGIICNRGNVQKEQVGNPDRFISLANLPMESWRADECPLCASGIPVNTNAGKGKVFLMQNSQSAH